MIDEGFYRQMVRDRQRLAVEGRYLLLIADVVVSVAEEATTWERRGDKSYLVVHWKKLPARHALLTRKEFWNGQICTIGFRWRPEPLVDFVQLYSQEQILESARDIAA